MDTFIFRTRHTDPWHNLALEEHLLGEVRKDDFVLYLWQNQNTVVIGKNQNPWKECRLEELKADGGRLARRISGGGAVFHDLGNLNFSFLMGRAHYNLGRQLEVILGALRGCGIVAQFSGRHDLTVDGRKFSGNAFCFKPGGALHHGTLLLDADMKKLGRYLKVSDEKIKSKGVASVQARVVNLKEYEPSLTIDALCDALSSSFLEMYGGKGIRLDEDERIEGKIEPLFRKHCSWPWLYGESPRFDIELDKRFSWGGIEIGRAHV